jgi:hypothetical protein
MLCVDSTPPAVLTDKNLPNKSQVFPESRANLEQIAPKWVAAGDRYASKAAVNR